MPAAVDGPGWDVAVPTGREGAKEGPTVPLSRTTTGDDGAGGVDAGAVGTAGASAQPPSTRSGLRSVPRAVWWGLAGVAVIVLLVTEIGRQSLVIGLSEQAPLLLAAFGFALLYRLTGLINVAYSETITLGAYFAVWLNTTFGLGFYAVAVPAGILAGLVSVATYLGIFRPAKRRGVGALELIIISFGLSLFLRYSLQFVFGYPVRFFDVPPPDTVFVLGVGVSSFRLLAVAVVVVVAVALLLFIQRSRYGLQIRALASDENLAQVSGIRPLAVTVFIWFIAGMAGGLAGAFYGVGASVSPLLGWREFLLILLVVLVGGVWGLRGVLVVGAVTGVVKTALSLQLGEALYAELLLIVAFIAILKVRGRSLTAHTKV
jgi:branched-subunit amino acid ABC-type transport system permease component